MGMVKEDGKTDFLAHMGNIKEEEKADIGFGDLRSSDLFSDCVIICGDEKIAAHKVILSVKSKFFRSALTNANTKEKEESVVVLNEPLPVVNCLLDFCYRDNYDECKHVPLDMSLISHNVAMYAAGIKYDLPGLKKLALKNFNHHANADVNSADYDNDGGKIFTEVLNAVEQIFKMPQDDALDLRSVAVTLIRQNDFLLDAHTEAWYDLVHKVPEVGIELAVATLRKVRAMEEKMVQRLECAKSECKFTFSAILSEVKDNWKFCPGCGKKNACKPSKKKSIIMESNPEKKN